MQPTNIGIYKHIYLLVLFISSFTISQSFSQTTEIPDSNFEEVLVNLNIDTNGLNGNILNSDAIGITQLSLSDNYIHDLSGLEAFVNLKALDCSFNNLSSIDLSQNIHLEELNANENQINSINVTLNSKLEFLSLSSNQLSFIDITNNLDLEHLSINLNNLTSLNVSNNINLDYLSCYSNNLPSIDVINNTNLKYLFINDNELMNLDVSQNILLKTLSCGSNELTTINLEDNSELNYLDCRINNITSLDLSVCIDLKRLFVSNNLLSELDVSNHPELLLLYARYNNLTSLDISNNPDLRWIRCEGNNLSNVDFRNGNNSRISEFVMTENSNLSCIFVDDAEAGYLANWLIDDASAFVEDESDCEALSVVEEELTIGFNMFPNPATEMVSISINTNQADLEIYSIKGQLILNKPLTFGKNIIQLNALSSGMYLVKITSDNFTEAKKLLLN
ncbi:T9SS type A sorting domain-containing protein [Formosa maritima]|uniref:T9SS type A sorting domain-containing protein n=1 Tax=Formosa maritima TaxID=2592046 RepID=A0A5D0GMP6_9FLAO|nr:T9SS type A sorting domain-containing protein [Formosa maritima]TYA58977.1 T9SS type A sorting domain-containing protein [Formosa maritima]